MTPSSLHVTYHLTGAEPTARALAEDICIEQTVEFPLALVPPEIRATVVGQISTFTRLDENHFQAVIQYAAETTGFELTQLLNVLFGNTSLKPGIRVAAIDLPEPLLRAFAGPRFGVGGWRALLGVPQRPLLCTALKPMGLSATALAELAYQFARGGIDLIKDDHGLANQSYAPFRERVQRCAAAVAQANAETGYHCAYVPNLTAPGTQLLENAAWAKAAGVGGGMVAPGLTGWSMLQQLANDASWNLPLLAHPALLGSFVAHPASGMAHEVVFGLLPRLAGADASVFPHAGGRFSFSLAECAAIAGAAQRPLGSLAPIFPAPGGGMSLHRLPELRATYGDDVVLLIGGGLHTHGPDLVANCRYFRERVEGEVGSQVDR